jgi:hypothetical protein
LLTLPPKTPSFFLVGVFAFFGVVDCWDEVVVVAKELLLVVVVEEVPRAGAGARAPESISERRVVASRFMMRKRPSIES